MRAITGQAGGTASGSGPPAGSSSGPREDPRKSHSPGGRRGRSGCVLPALRSFRGASRRSHGGVLHRMPRRASRLVRGSSRGALDNQGDRSRDGEGQRKFRAYSARFGITGTNVCRLHHVKPSISGLRIAGSGRVSTRDTCRPSSRSARAEPCSPAVCAPKWGYPLGASRLRLPVSPVASRRGSRRFMSQGSI